MTFLRSVIITGGTSNLGYHAAATIAREHPDYLVVISSRSDGNDAAGRINKALGQSNVVFLKLDLAGLDSVRAYADNLRRLSKEFPPIQALLLNAGLQFPGQTRKAAVTGIEQTFAINHVGHALLFHLLYPLLLPAPGGGGARVVITSSGTHDPDQKTGGFPVPVFTTAEEVAHPPPAVATAAAAAAAGDGRVHYSTSKLCNVLWAYALNRRLQQQRAPQITVTVFDPGLMPGTGLAREYGRVSRFVWNKILPRMLPVIRLAMGSDNVHTAEKSGANLARLAVGPDVEGISGKYFEGAKEIPSSKASYDQSKQDDLWAWTIDFLAKGNVAEAVQWDELR
ncbi:hypothetical protein B0H63DRAFT_496601 [Podospora didyma]|uniref:Dehydrogenase/reductase n=1 Tax=Podospora didyma TaxID=330526 RepID=A0AAE0KFW8_9PEZI|nr:hypothetical protein B0H63DRAFT_496601 [Podospora didyma]